MPGKPLFADIILPLAIAGSYTYRVPADLAGKIQKGMRVVVPLGPRKLYTGIVGRLHDEIPDAVQIKDIDELLDAEPIVTPHQLKLWDWMSDYYMCSLGEVYKSALPAGLKLESEAGLSLNETFEGIDKLSDDQKAIWNYLQKKEYARISEISLNTGLQKTQVAIKSMVEAEAVFLEEKLRFSYKPKKEVYLRMALAGVELVKSKDWEQQFARSPKQLELFLKIFSETVEEKKQLKQSLLYNSFSLNIINALFKKQLIEKYEVQSLRTHVYSGKIREIFPLSDLQKTAFEKLESGFKEKNVQLIHGVTSSGKTEIYIHLIKKVIDSGRQALYLLPEIALTSQIVNRIEEVFGDRIAVYHSKFSDSERVDVYKNLLRGKKEEKKLILGVRSALFLPFRDLGLIIVDEEHENTYKQIDPAPRYHTRDSAIILANFFKAKVLLGTATPSLETYMNCKTGKYGLVELFERYGGVKLPEIKIVDLRKARLKKEMRSVFAPLLIDEMEKSLKNGKQIILFQNRRGYSSFIECDTCGWVPKCESCDVSLTYHKYENKLRCHYCGHSKNIPSKCDECSSTRLATKGFGTELVEDELEMILPGARIARLDLDSTRSGKSYERILKAFGRGDTDILVGTQMLSKGLDFENVAMVGILNADQMLNFPDFRAFERSFQLMSQVSGRAGRKKDQGKVIIQTTDPGHPIIQHVLNNDFNSFYAEQVAERQEFRYPPYVRIVKILVKSKEKLDGIKAVNDLAEKLRLNFGNRVLGPHPPLVSRVKNWYLQQILIKVEKQASFSKARLLLRKVLAEEESNHKKVRINIDVDPL